MTLMTIVALAAAVQAPGGARQQATIVMPENARQRQMQEQIGWADAVVSNGVVYVSAFPLFSLPGRRTRKRPMHAPSMRLARPWNVRGFPGTTSSP